jgi:hypothetical protein
MKSLYYELLGVMNRYGKDDACGDGQYWVVDHHEDSDLQEIVINDAKLIENADEMLSNIKAVLADYDESEVVVSLSLRSPVFRFDGYAVVNGRGFSVAKVIIPAVL